MGEFVRRVDFFVPKPYGTAIDFMSQMNSTNQDPSASPAESSSSQTVDQTPSGEAVGDRSEAQLAAEAARVGLADNSANVGASVAVNQEHMAAGKPTTAGDPDAMQEQAKVVGEEAIGGTTPTPDQSNVDDIGAAVGVNVKPEHPVNIVNEMHKRDDQRYELDPESKGPASSV